MINIYHSIEVENVPNIWAVDFNECKQEMKPVKMNFIEVNNSLKNNSIKYIENIIKDSIPVKIIDGVNGGISDDYIQVGFWKIKHND